MIVGDPSKARAQWRCTKTKSRSPKPCGFFTILSVTSRHSKNNEDLKEQNSELEERLRVLLKEKATLQLGTEELQKKLEMSELLLQQVRGNRLPGPGPGPQAAISRDS